MYIQTSYKMNLRHFTKMDKIKTQYKSEAHVRVESKKKQGNSHKMEIKKLSKT